MGQPAAPTDPAGGAAVLPVTVAGMQGIDRHAIDACGIPRVLLMDHAGLAVATHTHQRCPRASTPVAICCGMGFNGGDGLSAARHLEAFGHPVHVLLVGERSQLREEPAVFARILERLEVPLEEVRAADMVRAREVLGSSGVIVDALLGIGGTGRVREPYRALILAINAAGRPVIAVDVPSGLDADRGVIPDVAVRAAATVTFGRPKQGCLRGDGAACTGVLITERITFPPRVLEIQA